MTISRHKDLECKVCKILTDRTWKSTVNGKWTEMCIDCWRKNEGEKLKKES